MRLYLVRHGEAKPAEQDPDRHLTDTGAAEVRQLADWLRPLDLGVDEIWHSGKTRAHQTAQILASVVSAPQEVTQRSGLSPNDPVEPISQAVSRSGGDLMIVGHLPMLGKLAALLLAGDQRRQIVNFCCGGTACLEGRGAGGWQLAWMIVPDVISSKD